MITYGCIDDKGVKDQGHVYFKSVYYHGFATKGVYIWHNYCLWCVEYKRSFQFTMIMESMVTVAYTSNMSYS